jgi:hypothetical protein
MAIMTGQLEIDEARPSALERGAEAAARALQSLFEPNVTIH